MAFQLDCACGSRLIVAAGAAGTTITCSCGRDVVIPSLANMRGLPEVSEPLRGDPPLPGGRIVSSSQRLRAQGALCAAGLFFLVRVVIGLAFVGMLRPSYLTGGIEHVPWIAALFSSATGGVIWWLFMPEAPSVGRGALVGFLAATAGYVGVAFDDTGYAFFGAGISGPAVFPAFMIVGGALGWLQRKSAITP